MDENALVTIIKAEMTSSIGGTVGGTVSRGTSSSSSDLASERAMELDYYNSQPLGNERPNESQVVSSDVFDAVEGMLPQLLKIFTASDDAVEFQPQGLEDEEAAKQRTDLCNYVFYRQNSGFLLMYEWFKDALLQKNGVVKYWWEEKKDVTEENYEGLTEGEYIQMVNDPDIEVLEHTDYPDPVGEQQKAQILQQLQGKAPPEAIAQVQAQPVPMVHDLKIRQTKDASQICIEAVPPEEFGISSKQRCISIQKTPFCFNKTLTSISSLREQGCPDEILDNLNTGEDGPDDKPEVLARNRFTDETAKADTSDQPSREVWSVDGFIRADFDDDGIAELRHFIMVGNKLWVNEKAEHICFAAITPIIMPHRFIGKSIAEIVMDVQFLNSVIWRQMLNNLYLTNNPRKAVLSTSSGQVQANLDDLLTVTPGGIVREYVANAVRELETPFVAGASFPMIEYMQGVKENRTGVTRYNQGTDADSLNKTARGISLIQSAAQQKIDLIARIFAETGVKDLFRGIAFLLSKYSARKMAIRLRGKWVDVDPREWKNQFDMTVNVGLGTGNKDAQLVHLAKMNEVQIQLMKEGRGYMVTDQNLFNLSQKMAENMGFKNQGQFITDPSQVQKPPPQPNPEMLKIQQADQEVKLKIQSNEKIRQFDAQTQKEIEAIKGQALVQAEQVRANLQKELEIMRIQSQHQLAMFNAQASQKGIDPLEVAKAEKTAEVDIYKAQLASATTIEVANISATKQAAPPEAVNTQANSDAVDLAPILSKIGEALSAQAMLTQQGLSEKAQSRRHIVKTLPDGSTEITSTVH